MKVKKIATKTISMALTIVLMIGIIPLTSGAYDFTDADDITYKEAVDVMTGIHVIDGFPEGDFRPHDGVRRSEAAAIISRLFLGRNLAESLPDAPTGFSDVDGISGVRFAVKYIVYCKYQNINIVAGCPDGMFCPNDTITATQFAVMLLSALGYRKQGEYNGEAWQMYAILDGIDTGILRIDSDIDFTKPANREEIAQYAFNALIYTEDMTNREETPNAVIDFVNEQLTGLTEGMYSFEYGTSVMLSSTIYNIQEAWFGEILIIGKLGDGISTTNSLPFVIEIPFRPTSPDVTVTNQTEIDGTGSINGTTSEMEYRAAPAGTWISCATPNTTGIQPGIYQVRRKATSKVFASEITTVTINPYTPPEDWDNPYIDVSDDDWFYEGVRYVTENGLMAGTSATTFSPTTNISCAALSDALYRLEGSPAVSGDIPFTDVAEDDWYADAILWISQIRVLNGHGDGTFGPDVHLTREQIAVVLLRYADYKGLNINARADLSQLADIDDISLWALEAMQWAVAEGFIKGSSNNTILPQGTVTRAEFTYIFRLYVEWVIDGIGVKTITFHTNNPNGTLLEEEVSAQIAAAGLSPGDKFSATFDESVTAIIWAFRGNSDIISIDITDSVKTIVAITFMGCTGLKRVIIGNGLTTISLGVFNSCTNLESVVIGNNVANIYSNAFSLCTSLTSINIPDSVINIEGGAFSGCIGLTEINIGFENDSYSSIDGVLFNKDITLLHTYPAGKTGSYSIPDSVTVIGQGAIDGCIGLTSVIIPNSVKQLGDWAISSCPNLTNIVIPASVESIGALPFIHCDNLTEIIVDSQNNMFSSENGVLFSKNKATLITCPNGKSGSYSIPNSVTSIGNHAFTQCLKLINISIPDSTVSIGDEAFYHCPSLAKVVIGSSVKSIGDVAFDYCYLLSEVYFNGDAPEVGENAFSNTAPGAIAYVYKGAKGFPAEGQLWNGLIVKYRDEVITNPGGGGGGLTTYTVKFNTNGGSTVPDQKNIMSGGKVAKPDDPTKAGSIFDGWYSDAALTTLYNFDNTVASDVNLYAKWAEIITEPGTPTTSLLPYSDVATENWFYSAVQSVTDNGLMNGTGGDMFSPNVTMSRAMLVTVLYRLEGEPPVSGDIAFSDVKSGQWYSNAILWAAGNGIVEGYSDSVFGLNDPVTREQCVTILYRYAKTKGMDVSGLADLSVYTDAGDVSDWALDAMQWAIAAGIVQGRTATTIAPGESSMRAEVATIFVRYIEAFPDEVD